MARPPRFRARFTLVELVVVVLVIGFLIAVLLPAVNPPREARRRHACSYNVKQIGLSLQGYAAQQRTFPTNWGRGSDDGDKTTTGHSWLALILPYMDGDVLHNSIQFGEKVSYRDPTRDIDNLRAAKMSVPMFMCASDPHDGTSTTQAFLSGQAVGVTNYKAVAGSNWEGTNSGRYKNRKKDHGFGGRNAESYDGLDRGDGVICRGFVAPANPRLYPTSPMDIRDGLSNTFAIGETIPAFCNWSAWYWWNGSTATCAIPLNWEEPNAPRKNNGADWRSNWGFMSRHPNGAMFGLCDGSTRFVSNNIDMDVYRALATIDGAEDVQLPADW